jgi:DNA-binding GntR family transcriptional regulator
MKHAQQPVTTNERFGVRIDVAGTFSNSFASGPNVIKTLPEQLAEKLVELIINGVFEPGQRLHEVGLAEQFSVSRGPVREALRLLEREGLVTMASRKGAAVTQLTSKNLRDIFSVRSALMGICAEDLARRHSEEVQSTLDEGTRALFVAHEAGDVGGFLVVVYQVSMYLAEASGNEIAKTILFSLGRQTLSITRRVFETPEHRLMWANDWNEISEAIRAEDPVRARQSVRRLLDDTSKAAVAIYE